MSKKPKPPWVTIAIVVFGLTSQACASATSKPPAPPRAHAHKAPAPAEQEPYHVAPPPAYGNKIVLAQATER